MGSVVLGLPIKSPGGRALIRMPGAFWSSNLLGEGWRVAQALLGNGVWEARGILHYWDLPSRLERPAEGKKS